jgi:hypothetical protein
VFTVIVNVMPTCQGNALTASGFSISATPAREKAAGFPAAFHVINSDFS